MVALALAVLAFAIQLAWNTTRSEPSRSPRLRVDIKLPEVTRSVSANDVVLAPNGQHSLVMQTNAVPTK